ncbi:MAG TPA: hypothetical protein VFI13_03225, partial [Gemmatimonadales bacterium]|nr:hypothetical protein [Gemmatimonadales bacterium]
MRPSLLSLLLLAAPLAAQQPTTPPTPPPPASAAPRRPQGPPPLRAPTADTGVFQHLDLAPGNDLRTADGRPGPKYWQQRADYDIAATLDTAAKKLTGTVRITYTNNSPDT